MEHGIDAVYFVSNERLRIIIAIVEEEERRGKTWNFFYESRVHRTRSNTIAIYTRLKSLRNK